MKKTTKAVITATALLTLTGLMVLPLASSITDDSSDFYVSSEVKSVATLTNTTTFEQAFPDENFRKIIAPRIRSGYVDDDDKATFFTNPEIDTVHNTITWIDVVSKQIHSLEGIQHFKNLTNLNCPGNQISHLDMTQNTKMRFLDCGSNPIQALDVTGLVELGTLLVGYGKIGVLDISTNVNLGTLYATKNNLTSLDISNNPLLHTLDCGLNYFTTGLDLTGAAGLEILRADNSQFPTLNVSDSPLLTYVSVQANKLNALDFSANPLLSTLHIQGNQFATYNASLNPTLTDFRCDYNVITNVDLSNNPNLHTFTSANNLLTTLDFSATPMLSIFNAANNDITTLDMDALVHLTSVEVQNNLLTTLDFGAADQLHTLNASYNPLSSLVFHNDAKDVLKAINILGTEIASLDLSDFVALTNVFHATQTSNGDFSGIKDLAITGSRGYANPTYIRVHASEGAISWIDDVQDYYEISAHANNAYMYGVGYTNAVTTRPASVQGPITPFALTPALMDAEGNLIFDVTAADIEEDGSLLLLGGGTIATVASGTYTSTADIKASNFFAVTTGDIEFKANTATTAGAVSIEGTTVSVTGAKTTLNMLTGDIRIGRGGSVTKPDSTVVSYPYGGIVDKFGEDKSTFFTLDATVPGGNGSISGLPNGDVLIDEEFTLTATPASGHILDGWYINNVKVESGLTFDHIMVDDLTIEARFAPYQVTFTVDVTYTTGGIATVTQSGTVNENVVVTFEATPNIGYQFDGWFEGSTLVNSSLSYDFTVTRNILLEAQFSLIPITLYSFSVVNANPTMGDVVQSVVDGSYASGEVITVTATAKPGFRFVDWNQTGNNPGITLASASNTFTLSENTILTANFEITPIPANFTLTIEIDGNGSVTGAPLGSSTHIDGTILTLSAVANSGYKFVAWQDASGNSISTSVTLSVTMDENKTITAKFIVDVVEPPATPNDTLPVLIAASIIAGIVIVLTSALCIFFLVKAKKSNDKE